TEPSIDADGTRVAFSTIATNLSGTDTNNKKDVYLHDLTANTTTLISRATGATGTIGDGDSYSPSISDAGTRVAFVSLATNLAAGVVAFPQVYLRDVSGPTTTVISKSTGGTIGAIGSDQAAISGDGNRVAFVSPTAFDAVADTNVAQDVYVRDTVASTT